MMFDAVGLVVGFLLTVLVLSYLLGDNFAYRLVLQLFTGALMGYTFAVVIHTVGNIVIAQWQANNVLIVIPLLWGAVLAFLKGIRRIAYIGNIFLAFLIGVGVALALLGALLGTLVPQLRATGAVMQLDPAKGIIVALGAIFALFAFDFTLSQQQRGLAGTLGGFVRFLGSIGRIFVTIALGVAFAGALAASLTFFIGRIQYLFEILKGF